MWPVTKAGFSSLTSRVAWWRLTRWLVVLCLFTQQAWAGIVCNCQHDNDTQMTHACCPTAHQSDSAASAEQASEATHSSSSCSGAGAPGAEKQPAEEQLGAAPQVAMLCCHATPPAEVQGLTTPAPHPTAIVSAQPLINLDALPVSVSTYQQNSHQPHRTRPLYLSISCFLI